MYKEDLHFITNPNNIFSIQVYIPLGSIHEKKGQFGISHFLEHMKFRRSKRHSLNKMLQLFNNVPSFNAYTTKDHTSYYIRSNNGNGKGTYNDVVDLMYELVFNTSFTKNEIQTEKKIVEEEKHLRNPVESKFLEMDIESENSILAPENPYSRKVIGLMSDIKKINNKQLKAYNDRYLNDYSVVVNCPPSYVSKIKKYILDKFPKSRKENGIIPNSNDDMQNVDAFYYSLTFRDMPVQQNNTFLVFNSYSEKDKNKYYLDFVKHFFIDGKGSILGKVLREDKGYIYSLRSMHEGYKHYGCFRIHIASHNRNSTVEILKIVFSEIQKLKDKPLSKADLNKYKQRFIDSIDLAFSANDDDMMNTFGQFIYYDPTFNLKKYKAFINNITPSSLQTEIKRIFDFNSISIISYGKYSQNKINTSAEKTKKLLDKFRKLQDPESNANSNTDLNANSNAD